ncbi:MAG: hypothetical protein ACI9EZ_000504 [Halobacteriales archaeon]
MIDEEYAPFILHENPDKIPINRACGGFYDTLRERNVSHRFVLGRPVFADFHALTPPVTRARAYPNTLLDDLDEPQAEEPT